MTFIKKYKLHYAWVILAASCVLSIVSRADSASFAVFIDPLVAQFGWKRGDISFAYALAFLAGMPAMVAMGWLGDRYGARKLMIGASLLISTGTVLLGTIKELWQFYVFYGLFVGSLGNAAFTVLLPVIVTRWFNRHMGMALGIYWAALGAGPMIFAPLFRWLIETRGWERSFTLIGIVLGCILLVFSALIRSSPHEKGLSAYGSERQRRICSRRICYSACRSTRTSDPTPGLALNGRSSSRVRRTRHYPGASSVHGNLPRSVRNRGSGCAQHDSRRLDHQPFRFLHRHGAARWPGCPRDGGDWPEHFGPYSIVCQRSLGVLSVCRHLWPVLRGRDGRLPDYQPPVIRRKSAPQLDLLIRDAGCEHWHGFRRLAGRRPFRCLRSLYLGNSCFRSDGVPGTAVGSIPAAPQKIRRVPLRSRGHGLMDMDLPH